MPDFHNRLTKLKLEIHVLMKLTAFPFICRTVDGSGNTSADARVSPENGRHNNQDGRHVIQDGRHDIQDGRQSMVTGRQMGVRISPLYAPIIQQETSFSTGVHV